MILDAIYEGPETQCDEVAQPMVHASTHVRSSELFGAEQRHSILTIHIRDRVLGTLSEVLVHRSIQILRTYCFSCLPTNELPAPWNSYVVLHPCSVQS